MRKNFLAKTDSAANRQKTNGAVVVVDDDNVDRPLYQLLYPTDPSTFLELQNPQIDELFGPQKRRSADSEALKL